MQCSYTPTAGSLSGFDAWRDMSEMYGIGLTFNMAKVYLHMNLCRELTEGERQHSRDLFNAMYKATASQVNSQNLVYPYDLKIADERSESSFYHKNRKLNTECACGINRLIAHSCYAVSRYNLELAAMLAIMEYGFQRVSLILAFNYQSKDNDKRFNEENRKWVSSFSVHEEAFDDTWLNAHPTLIDEFCSYIRELQQHLGAERFALPGNEESGEVVINYEIKRTITTSDDGQGFTTGYAIGHSPTATISPWVCWQFAVRDGKRHYNHGVYCADEQSAIDSYIARVFVALNRGA